MHRLPLQLLLFAGALIGSLAVAQPYIVSDPSPRFDDPIVARPAAEAEVPPAPEVVEVDKLPAPPEPAPPVVAEAPPVDAEPPVVRVAPSCDDGADRRHAELRPTPRGDAAALAAREILGWGVLDDLLAARGDRSLPVPSGDAPPKGWANGEPPCAVTLQ